MYICCDCGHVFEEEEKQTIHEHIGDCFGFSAYDDYDVCPVCNGEISNSRECKICEEWFEWDTDEIDNHWCNSCKEKVKEKFNKFKDSIEKEELDCLVAMLEEVLC